MECYEELKDGHVAYNSSNDLIYLCQYLVTGYTLFQLPDSTGLEVDKSGVEIIDDMMLFSLKGIGLSQKSIEQLYNPMKYAQLIKDLGSKHVS